ncbi:MAG: DUF134 domain-containing protein [Bacteroidales bacterium]|nr:DUF134 domain-containing protein [Bacteroidales bacterium]
MPRRRRLRKVVAPPNFKGYRPYGSGRNAVDYVELFYEEYEAIKLADYNLMNHEEASSLMGISRATFARIYESARRKIAQALVGSLEIRAVYGNAVLDKSWYSCLKCHVRFTIPRSLNQEECPVCASKEIELLNK